MGHTCWGRRSSPSTRGRTDRCSLCYGRNLFTFKRRAGCKRACHGSRGKIPGFLSLRDAATRIPLPSIRNNNYGCAGEEGGREEDSPLVWDSQGSSSSSAYDRPVLLYRWL